MGVVEINEKETGTPACVEDKATVRVYADPPAVKVVAPTTGLNATVVLAIALRLNEAAV